MPDVSTESRWGDCGGYALSKGIRSVFSVPLTVDGQVRGALNLFATTPHAFTHQAATALTILLRHASHAPTAHRTPLTHTPTLIGRTPACPVTIEQQAGGPAGSGPSGGRCPRP